MRIVYTGQSDFQEFSKADFAKAGIEHNKIRFVKDVPQEVHDEVGAALVSKDADESPIFHDFPFEEVEAADDGDELDEDDESEEEPEPKAAKKAAKKSKKAVDQRAEGQSTQGSTSSDGDAGASGTTETTGARSTGGSTS